MGALSGLVGAGRRVRQRWKSQKAPTMMAASNGIPKKVWVQPR